VQLVHESLLFALNRSEFTQKHVLASEAGASQGDAQQDQPKQKVVEVHGYALDPPYSSSESKLRALLLGHCTLHRLDFILDSHEFIAVGLVGSGNLKARDQAAAPMNELVTQQG
jgi:hypothetical protein